MKTLKNAGIAVLLTAVYFLGFSSAMNSSSLKAEARNVKSQKCDTYKCMSIEELKAHGRKEQAEADERNRRSIEAKRVKILENDTMLFNDFDRPLPKIVNSKTGTWTKEDDIQMLEELVHIIDIFRSTKPEHFATAKAVEFRFQGRIYEMRKTIGPLKGKNVESLTIWDRTFECGKDEKPRECGRPNAHIYFR